MTSASELFYTHRSRGLSRDPNPNPQLLHDPSSNHRHHDLHHHHHQRRRRVHRHHQTIDCAPSSFSRPSRGPHHSSQSTTTTVQEHEPVQADNIGLHYSATGNNNNDVTPSSSVRRPTLTRNDGGDDRLPGAVLQARARLLERLRGVSLMRNRQNSTASSISPDEFAVSDEFGVIDSRDWETEANIYTDLAEANQRASFQSTSKKPSGLSEEAVCSMPRELYKTEEGSNGVMRESLECCICLDRFRDGDRLFHLPCGHRFHSACLEPWLMTCGSCPYCRAKI